MAAMTPLDWLAIAMATRAKEAGAGVPTQADYEKNLVGQRVTKYGGDMGAYEDVWQRGYGPQAESAQATNKQMYDYWMGLPEALVKAAKEGLPKGTQTANTGLGSSRTQSVTDQLVAMYGPDVFARGTSGFMYPYSPTVSTGGAGMTSPGGYRGSADVVAGRAAQAPRARSLSAPRSRQVRF